MPPCVARSGLPWYDRASSGEGGGGHGDGNRSMTDTGGQSGDAIRVLIVDDHALFRRGLTQVLQFEDGIEVVGEGEDGEDAITKAEELAPDVVLMDVRMPHVSGIDATRRLSDTLPTTKILMLT